MNLCRLLLAAAVGLAALVSALPAPLAQDYPSRPVRIVVPFPAGGSADVVPRVVGDYLSRKWGHPVVIENRPGAAGNIGSEVVYKADPDGYTLLSAPPPPLVINHNLYPKLNFDPTQFIPIAVMARIPNALVVAPGFKPKTVAEVIAYAKANPGKINSAIQGIGATSHLTSEMFQLDAGVKLQHVPYTGSAPALNDLVGGQVDIMFDNLGVSLALVEGKQAQAACGREPEAHGGPERRSDHRRDAAGLRVGSVLLGGCAAEDADGDRQQDQCRHQRSVAPAGRAGAPDQNVRGGRRRHAAGDRGLFQVRGGALAEGDQVRECETAVSKCGVA